MTGEEISDGSGFGKNREPEGLGKAESSDGVVERVVGGGAGAVPLEWESIDNKFLGGSRIRSFGGVGVGASFGSIEELGCSTAGWGSETDATPDSPAKSIDQFR